MKNKKLLFSIILLSLIITSCKQLASDFEEKKENSDSFLKVILQDIPSRTILPEKYNYTDFEYELYGTDSDGNQSLLQTWTTYESMTSSKVNIKTGEWILELHALKNSEIALTGIYSTNIQLGENTVSFTLTESSYGNGNLFIELFFPEDLAQKIEAKLLTESGSSIKGFENVNLLKEYDSAKEKNKAIYQLTNIPKGYYLIRFFLYKNETDTNYFSVYNTFARIEPCFTSYGVEKIDLSESMYEISIPIDHIEITNIPDTTIYYAEQTLSLEGLEVNACYKDGKKEQITNYTTSMEEGDILSPTDNLITIAYGEFTDSFEISVIPNSLDDIYITIPSMEQDIYDLLSYSYDTNIFTAKNGFSAYEWWLDGGKTNNLTRYFTINSTILSSGNHNLMLVAKDYSGKKYSASSEFAIYENSLSFIKVAIENLTEISGLLYFNETSFTATSGFSKYIWWIDDEMQSISDSILSLPDNLNPGHHTVTVIVKDNENNYFSELKTVSVTKDNLKLDDNIIANITVKMLDYQDADDLLTYDDILQRFIVKKGYTSYVWWIDSTKQTETKNYYTLTNTISKGNHTILIVVEDSKGNHYSTSRSFYISAENLQLNENSDTTNIYVSFSDYDDVVDLLTYDNENQKFEAKKGYQTYSWWINGTKITEANKSFKLKESDYSVGNHTVMLIVTDSSGNTYSASKIFTISGTYLESYCANTAIYVVLPTYQEIEDLLIYEDSLFHAKSGFSTYTWWLDDIKTSQTGKRFSISNLSKGNHNLMLIVEATSGDVYSSTAEIAIY